MFSHQVVGGGVNVSYDSIGVLFDRYLNSCPDKQFLVFPGLEDEVFTYKDFSDAYKRAAAFLLRQGLKRGDRFNIVFGNSSAFLLFYFAGLRLGITVVPINPDLSASEIRYIVKDSGSKLVVYGVSLRSKVEEAVLGLEALISAIGIDSIDDCPVDSSSFPNATSAYLADADLDDEAVIIYTSGTTGNPKGVVLSHLNILADSKAIAEWFDFSKETRALCILPLFHNNGQITTFLAPLYAGGTAVIVKSKASLMSFWSLADKHGITFTSVMASILSILLSVPTPRKDKTLRAILCGGQALSKNVQLQFEERFQVPVFEGFGLTETTSFSCINEYPRIGDLRGSIGKSLPVNDMAILDDNDVEVAAGTEGQICIRGHNVACEYLNLPERNIKSFANGWFHSGDYGYMDEDGYFYFRGRKDFLIIKGGENIYPAELENVLYKHASVAECAVIGIPDPLLGEDVCAFVKLHDGVAASGAELKEFCRGKIASYKQPKIVIIVDNLPDLHELPKGPTKKVLYRILVEYFVKNRDLLINC